MLPRFLNIYMLLPDDKRRFEDLGFNDEDEELTMQQFVLRRCRVEINNTRHIIYNHNKTKCFFPSQTLKVFFEEFVQRNQSKTCVRIFANTKKLSPSIKLSTTIPLTQPNRAKLDIARNVKSPGEKNLANGLTKAPPLFDKYNSSLGVPPAIAHSSNRPPPIINGDFKEEDGEANGDDIGPDDSVSVNGDNDDNISQVSQDSQYADHPEIKAIIMNRCVTRFTNGDFHRMAEEYQDLKRNQREMKLSRLMPFTAVCLEQIFRKPFK